MADSNASLEVKWFTDGAQFHKNHELLIWLWSCPLAKSGWLTRFVFGAIPHRLIPTKSLRRKANEAMVKAIAWDSGSAKFKSCAR